MSATKIWLSRDADYVLSNDHILWVGEPIFYDEAGVYSPGNDCRFLGRFTFAEMIKVGLTLLDFGARTVIDIQRAGRLLDGQIHEG